MTGPAPRPAKAQEKRGRGAGPFEYGPGFIISGTLRPDGFLND